MCFSDLTVYGTLETMLKGGGTQGESLGTAVYAFISTWETEAGSL